MQNYDEMLKRQQQDYQRSRNPFEYGRQVSQRRYSEIMANIDAQRRGMTQSYGDLYQQARQRAIGQQAASGLTLTGGMGQQQRDFISTAEMQQLGQIGRAREQASRDLFTQAQSAFSNAQLEGQQATQMELQNRQTELQLLQQRQAILDSDLSAEQKAQQLAILEGGDPGQAKATPKTVGQSIATGLSISAGIGIPTLAAAKSLATGARAITTAGKLLSSGKVLGTLTAGGKVAAAAKGVAATAGASKGLGAVWIGAKALLLKTGLAKGAAIGTAKAATLALTGIGPVGWGIIAIVGLGLALGGIIALANSNK